MRSPGINGEGELRGQPANPGSPRKMAVKTERVCVCSYRYIGAVRAEGNAASTQYIRINRTLPSHCV